MIAFGAALNMWTTRHGALIGPDTTVIQVDRDEEAIGAHRPVDLGVVGDARLTAEALLEALDAPVAAPTRPRGAASRSPPRSRRALARRAVRGEPRLARPARRCRSRSTTCCPTERTVVVDSGAFMGYPSMYLRVPGRRAASCSRRRSSASGSALGNAIGAAIARPDRLTVCAVGDGGLLMALPDLETLGRLELNMLVVIYDDAAYGAEVHHFRPLGIPVELAQFPPTDFAALAEAAGCRGVTARTSRTSKPSASGSTHRDRPLVLDAKVDPDICAEWLEEAFRGH